MLERELIEMTDEQRSILRRRAPNAVSKFLLKTLFQTHDQSEIDQDIAEGRLERLAVEGTWLARGTEHGDEGPILFMGSGEAVLILMGQWLYDPHIVGEAYPEQGFFKSFSLVRARHSGVPFALKPFTMDILPVTRELGGDALSNLMKMPGTGDTALIAGGSVEQLEGALQAFDKL